MLSPPISASDSIPPSPGLSPGLTDTSASLDQFLDLDSFLDQPNGPSTSDAFLFAGDQYTALTSGDPSGMDAQDLFKMYLDGENGKAPATSFDTSDVPFSMADLQSLAASTGPSSTFATAASAAFGTESLSAPVINPSFMHTPSPSLPEFEAIDEEDEEAMVMDEDADESEDEEVKPRRKKATTSTRSKRASTAAATNKASVASLALPVDESKPVSAGTNGKLPHIVFPVPDYIDRPSPEAYKKMNSKEKRQLRNKISARNFRHRRKEYITTLEEEIASRDSTIAAMRGEMGALRIENGELKRDVSLLKQQFEQAMAKIGGITPATSESSASCSPSSGIVPLGASTNSEPAAARRASRPVLKPNLTKDVIPGASAWGPGGFGGISRDLGVHHTILPEHRFPSLDGKPRNLNPLLDGLDALKSEHTAHMRDTNRTFGLHDDFTESNPYTFTGAAAEAYRGQLYAKIAHNLSGLSRGGKTEDGKRSFPADFRPAFFTSSPLTSSLSGKPAPTASTSSESQQRLPLLPEEQEAAYVAGHATTTLFTRMASAFADAFAGPSSSSKVADVLAGRSRVQVIPSLASTSEATSAAAVDEVATRLAGMRMESCLTSALFGAATARRSSEESERPSTPTS